MGKIKLPGQVEPSFTYEQSESSCSNVFYLSESESDYIAKTIGREDLSYDNPWHGLDKVIREALELIIDLSKVEIFYYRKHFRIKVNNHTFGSSKNIVLQALKSALDNIGQFITGFDTYDDSILNISYRKNIEEEAFYLDKDKRAEFRKNLKEDFSSLIKMYNLKLTEIKNETYYELRDIFPKFNITYRYSSHDNRNFYSINVGNQPLSFIEKIAKIFNKNGIDVSSIFVEENHIIRFKFDSCEMLPKNIFTIIKEDFTKMMEKQSKFATRIDQQRENAKINNCCAIM